MEMAMKLRTFGLLVAAGVMMIAVNPAFALDLATARASGVVGEKTDGYVAVIKESADADALAAEVNGRRKAEYAKISAANSQPVAVVAKLAAEEIIGKLPSGAKYQNASGAWVSK
ncbi:MAG: hypothetical protein JWO78_1575 [Micavibrio sp.]|nr:hypothetical protein [Micavibrio sp.]